MVYAGLVRASWAWSGVVEDVGAKVVTWKIAGTVKVHPVVWWPRGSPGGGPLCPELPAGDDTGKVQTRAAVALHRV